ncbi:MAG: endonuclease/exonuclease/phosphatase family protein [Bacteroidota bacterium]|nr:endonuclease/exonuclease/phosphatase family protein [Bacteroidota bacterium]
MAKSVVRRAVKIFFISLNAVVMVLFLMACAGSWLGPGWFSWVGFTVLSMPYLILLLILSIIFWLLAKPRFVLLPLITLLVGWKQISTLFAFHARAGFSKAPLSLRIADWNVQGFNGLSKNKETKKHIRESIAKTLVQLRPDIICLQEFNHSEQNNLGDNIGLLNQQYPYHFFSKDYIRKNGYRSGCIIFSKYPIIDSGKVKYPLAESLIYADVVRGPDTLRIFTTHLQSYQFKKEDYDDMEKIKEDESLVASRNIFMKMNTAFKRRGIQAQIVRSALNESPYPSIICGDFNDVPNSYTYWHIRGERKDAFLEKDFGLGRSFISLSPTLRIDYIMPDPSFDVLQFDMVDEDLSDHIMLVTDLRLKK